MRFERPGPRVGTIPQPRCSAIIRHHAQQLHRRRYRFRLGTPRIAGSMLPRVPPQFRMGIEFIGLGDSCSNTWHVSEWLCRSARGRKSEMRCACEQNKDRRHARHTLDYEAKILWWARASVGHGVSPHSQSPSTGLPPHRSHSAGVC